MVHIHIHIDMYIHIYILGLYNERWRAILRAWVRDGDFYWLWSQLREGATANGVLLSVPMWLCQSQKAPYSCIYYIQTAKITI